MPLGRKVADIYAELNLDKSAIRTAMAAAGGEMGADADRLGKQLGDRMSKGMAERVEALSTKVAKARLAEQKATDAVALAQARLNEANAKGNVQGSRLLALQQHLSQAEGRLALAHDNTTKAVSRHADAEHRLAADLENLGKNMGPAADRAGRDTGDKLSQGIHLAIIRNSPLIAAAIGGALAAGAPVALAGATALFAGIGIVAGAQSDKVKSAWAGTWNSIKTTAETAAAPISAELEHLAGVANQRFQEMSGDIASAFSDSVPLIDRFSTSVLNSADNALPGLERALENAGPAVDGLGNLVESTGTGLGQFFDDISQHGPAAGQVFSSLGDIIGNVLPVVSKLLGAGTELASHVLPLIASATGVVDDALGGMAPELPQILGGLAGFKIGGMVAGWMGSAASAIGKAGDAMGGATEDGGALAGIMSTIGDNADEISEKAGPLLGAVISGVTVVMERAAEQADQWAQAIMKGGRDADLARQQMSNFGEAMKATNTGFGGVITGLVGFSAQVDATALALKEEKNRAAELKENMTPLEAAQQAVSAAQADLNDKVNTYGVHSGQAEGATVRYRDAQAKLETEQGKLEQAIHGVTQAMIDQADQAIASIDSSFALQHAQNQQRDAEAALAKAIHDHGASSVEAHDAQQDYAESIYRTAEAEAQLKADQSGLSSDTLEYKQLLDSQLLVSLEKVRGTLTGPARDAVDGFIKTLQDAGVSTDVAAGKLDNLGSKKPKPTADLDLGPLKAKTAAALTDLFGLQKQQPTPTARMNAAPFSATLSGLNSALNGLNFRRVYPVATMVANTYRAEQALNLAARNRVSYITTYVQTVGGLGRQGMVATGGKIGDVVGRRFDFGGKISGPGGPTDDLVQAVTNMGVPLRVSNTEWVIKGSSSAKYGDYKMAAVNDGRAVITVPGPRPAARFATGGSPSGGGDGASITVQGGMTLSFPNVTTIADPDLPRQLLLAIQQGLRKLERSQR